MNKLVIPTLVAAITFGALPAYAADRPVTPEPTAPAVVAAPPSTITASSDVTRTTLQNGMRIVVKREPETPLVAVDVVVKVGSGQEGPTTAGIGSFVARTLLASTTSRSVETIQDEISDLGGNVSVTRQPDWTEISGLTVPDKFPDMVSLITDVIKNATFDPDTVEDKRKDILNDIDTGTASVFDESYNNLRAGLFSGTGYDLPALGTPRSIVRIPRTQLLRYYYEYFIPKNMVFVVVGNVDPRDAIAAVTSGMADYDPFLRGSRRRTPDQTPLPILTSDVPAVHTVIPDLAEVCVMLGYRAPSMSSPDYASLQVLNALLGGMKTSRMFTELREKQGLAYELGSFYSPQMYSGDLTAFVFAAPAHIDPATKKSVGTIAMIRDQMLTQVEAMKTAPPSAVDLARAKHYLIGTYKIKHERVEDRASLIGVAELTAAEGADLDENYADYINAVTADDVVRVAKKYLVHPVVSYTEPDPSNGGAVAE
jgi:zinc protease